MRTGVVYYVCQVRRVPLTGWADRGKAVQTSGRRTRAGGAVWQTCPQGSRGKGKATG